MIEFDNIYKSFGAKRVLDGVNLSITEGRVTFIIGKSGTGKSVLMKHAVGLLEPDAGSCRFDGVTVNARDEDAIFDIRTKCSYVFQAGALLDSMSILDNVALPIMQHTGVSQETGRKQAMAYLDEVGARSAAYRGPAEVGGGVRKQAAMARALAVKPKCLILDEPTTSLDPVAARSLDRLTRKLADDHGITFVVVSHDLKSIFGIADEIVFLHDGRVHAHGHPDEIRASEEQVLRGFLDGRPQNWQERING